MSIKFRSHTDKTTGFLSSYSEEGEFKDSDGNVYATLRHWYNAQKFSGASIIDFKAVLESVSPLRADALGQDRLRRIRDDWNKVKVDVMKEGARMRFEQNPDLATRLLATGDAELIYSTGRDTFWGCGSKSDGKNIYGNILMEIRKMLNNSAATDDNDTKPLGQISESVMNECPDGVTKDALAFTFPTIYKQRSDGGFQQSEMKVVWEGPNPEIVTVHGMVDGAQQEVRVEIIEAKSQASLLDQAVFECRSKWQKKVDSGYALEMTAHTDLDFRPMLAKKFDARKKALAKLLKQGGHKLHIQAKLDGIRGNLLWKGAVPILQSRKGKNITNGMEHIVAVFSEFFEEHPNIILDGEVYVHGKALQDISGAARRGSSDDSDSLNSDELRFVVYDAYHIDNPDLGYQERFYDHTVFTLLKKLEADGTPIMTIESLFKTKAVTCGDTFEARIVDIHRNAVDEGFEGVMVRLCSEPYKVNGRASGLVKYKTFMDVEAKIIDVTTPETGSMAGQAIFICEMHAFDDPTQPLVQFAITPMGSVDVREGYYNDRANIIGQMGTLKFHAYTKDGKPFHANFVAIRDYE